MRFFVVVANATHAIRSIDTDSILRREPSGYLHPLFRMAMDVSAFN